MKLWEWFLMELRRLFRGKELILTTLLTPVLAIIVFASVVAPLLVQGGGKAKISFGIYNEDDSPEIIEMVQFMLNSETVRELATAYPVEDKETGLRLLSEGRISVLVHVPENSYSTLISNNKAPLYLTAYQSHSFDETMLEILITGSLIDVVQTNELAGAAEYALVEAGVPEDDALAFSSELLMECVEEYMYRHAIIGKSNQVSPVEESFPLERYFSTLFSIFAGLAMLPLIHLTAYDLNGPVFKRGLLSEPRFFARFVITRILSGATLIFLSLFAFIPSAVILQNTPAFLGTTDPDPFVWPALAMSLVLTSFTFSALALLIGSAVRRGNLAVWVGFFFVIVMALLAGVLIPAGTMPRYLSQIGKFVPLKVVMEIMSNLLFRIEHARYFADMLRLLVMALIIGTAGVLTVNGRRAVR